MEKFSKNELLAIVELIEEAKKNYVKELAKCEQAEWGYYDKVYLENQLNKANKIIRKIKDN